MCDNTLLFIREHSIQPWIPKPIYLFKDRLRANGLRLQLRLVDKTTKNSDMDYFRGILGGGEDCDTKGYEVVMKPLTEQIKKYCHVADP